jgi:hypothetical protein
MSLAVPSLGGGLDLAACPMSLWHGEDVVSAGSGAACPGRPAVFAGGTR